MTEVTSHGRETALHQDMLYGFSVIICYVKLKTNTCQFYSQNVKNFKKGEKKQGMCNEKQNKKLHVNWSVNSPVSNTAGV